MKKSKILITLTFFLFVGHVPPARAGLFGGDVSVLVQILAQAVSQLAKLKELLSSANESLDLVRDINRGINDSLDLIRTIDPNIDSGIYKDWTDLNDSTRQLESIYGAPTPSAEEKVQRDLDRGIVEAVNFNNSYYAYSKTLDEMSEQIKSASHSVSPGGATKLTAEALGLVIQVLNQNLRAQATGLKLHAQELAVQNHKEKADTKFFLDATGSLKQAMHNEKIKFELPEYK